jgi:DeoR/GlpR family transcriptional regulator of sugar metabolism
MKSFSKVRRQERLLAEVARHGQISVLDLIQASGASAATVRRDIQELVDRGLLMQLRGGVFWPGKEPGEVPHRNRSGESREAKQRIAGEVARMIPENSTIFLDSGTTCLAVAQQLVEKPSLTIYTNSMALVELLPRCAARIFFLGGEARPVSYALIGSLAEHVLGNLRLDIAILGASALDAGEGLFATEQGEAAIKRLAIRQCKRAILAADSSKIRAAASVRFARWTELAAWVTDQGLPARIVKTIPLKICRI